MGNLGNVYFVFEVAVAEIIFLYAYPRRRFFVLRAVLSCAAVFVAAYFIPLPSIIGLRFLIMLIRYIVLWGMTLAGMCVCFSASFPAVLSACAAGYALQHFSYKLVTLLGLTGMFNFIHPRIVTRGFVSEMMIFPFTYLAAFFTFGRLAAKNHYYRNTDVRFVALSVGTVAICMVINRFAPRGDVFATIGTSLYAMTCTLFALIVQYVLRVSVESKEESAVLQRVLQEKEKQYESSMQNAELLNIKCHDLKYTISRLGGRLDKSEIDSINSLVDSYDSELKTGVTVLDVLLGEVSARCRNLGIKFTFLGDATRLKAMAPADIYSLFGNALDNAIEAVSKLTVDEMKQIGMTVEPREGSVFVSVYNYYSGRLDMAGDLPASTKKADKGYHGYGLKSIRLIAERYGGDISYSASGGIFRLGIRLKS